MSNSNCTIKTYGREHWQKTVEWLNRDDIRQLFGITYQATLESHEKFIVGHPNVELLPLYAAEEYVGNIILFHTPRHFTSYLQIYLGSPDHRGKGLGEMFMKQALTYAFKQKGHNRVWLHVREHNEAAIKLYRKLGFVQEGLERQSIWTGQEFLNQITMGILASEFKGAE